VTAGSSRAFLGWISTITWNYTTVLNIAFLLLAAFLVLVVRFVRTNSLSMLKMMHGEPDRLA